MIRGRGGERKARRRSSKPPTMDSPSSRRRTSVEKTFRRETTASKDEAIQRSRGGTTIRSDGQGKYSHSNREDTRQKDSSQWTTRISTEVGELRVLQDFPT